MSSESQFFLSHLGQTSPFPFLIEVERAEGAYIYDKNGKAYLDMIAGVAVNNIGHRHPKVVAALEAQLKKHLHVMVYGEFIQDELQKAYLESYHEYGQNIFDRYISLADNWVDNKDYRDPDTGEMFDRETLNAELEKIEKAAGIANPKDFRHETVNYVLRYRGNHHKNPDWTSYEKLRTVIEKRMFSNTEELLPVISFGKKATAEEDTKHHDFVKRMMDKGYTQKQVRIAVLNGRIRE